MNETEKRAAWEIERQDPDNWLYIPDFGVNPKDVDFVGFTCPIVLPIDQGYWSQRIVLEEVRTARMLMRRDDFSISQIAEQLDEIRILSEGKLDSEYVKLSRTQGLAIYYTTVINQATAALISIRKVDTTSQETVCEKIARCTEAVRQLLIVSLKTQNALIRTAVNWAIARQSETHKSMLSKAGKRGASVKHQRVQALKQWALGEAETMRGSDMERARKLSARIPPQFADASIEPKRLIYDAIRGSK